MSSPQENISHIRSEGFVKVLSKFAKQRVESCLSVTSVEVDVNEDWVAFVAFATRRSVRPAQRLNYLAYGRRLATPHLSGENIGGEPAPRYC